MIYLASNSPRRQELLNQMAVPISLVAQYANEDQWPNESARNYVHRVALAKASDALARLDEKTFPVLAADTAVIIDGDILGKPENKEHAISILQRLSGNTHQVMTAIVMKTLQQTEYALSITDVTFAHLTYNECEQYWLSGEPKDKAGAYGIQGKGAVFISHINGSYSGVMGLPIYETKLLLEKFSVL